MEFDPNLLEELARWRPRALRLCVEGRVVALY
jgi:hypothetical protein